MSGTAIVRHLLANNGTLTGTVPPARITVGALPQGTSLPGISITEVVSTPRLTVGAPGAGTTFVSERVQVTVITKTLPQAKAILQLVRNALPFSRGAVGSFACDSILHDAEGPDFFDDVGEVHMSSQDFMVRFTR